MKFVKTSDIKYQKALQVDSVPVHLESGEKQHCAEHLQLVSWDSSDALLNAAVSPDLSSASREWQCDPGISLTALPSDHISSTPIFLEERSPIFIQIVQ
jgi:hypothetical protein